jgi:hypothetical protein
MGNGHAANSGREVGYRIFHVPDDGGTLKVLQTTYPVHPHL